MKGGQRLTVGTVSPYRTTLQIGATGGGYHRDLSAYQSQLRHGDLGVRALHLELSEAPSSRNLKLEHSQRFDEDGRICLSNNAAERALRGVAIGRGVWKFAGSDEGGPGFWREAQRSKRSGF